MIMISKFDSLSTSVPCKFMVILQNLMTTNLEKVVRIGMTANCQNSMP